MVPSRRSQTPGWGREEGAATSHTVRAQGKGGSEGRRVCGAGGGGQGRGRRELKPKFSLWP